MNLVQRTRSLFARKTAVRKPLARRCRPQLEGLTDRIAPAVTASVVAGVLTVKATGAAANDSLTVAPVAGFAGRFTLTGTNGTAVNAAANGTFDAIGVTSMRFDLGEGNDSVEANNLVLAGGISFRGGNGSNTLRLLDSFIGGSISVTNLTNTAGNDVTEFFRSTINGGVTVNNGLGSTRGQFVDTNILGSLKYSTPSSATIPGDESILVDALNVGGSIALALANGDNSLLATGFVRPLEAGGSFSYTGGSGTDLIDLYDATIGASATIALGDNTNSFLVSSGDGLFVGTRLAVTGGAGNDTITLNPSSVARVNGAASFNLGVGNNSFTTTGLRVGSLGLTTGGGDDTGTFDNLTVVGTATMNFGAGTNAVDLASTAAGRGASSIGGALTLTTGTGADTIRVGANNAFRVGGAAKFTLGTAAVGNGNDSLQINNSLFASSLSIVAGSGNDGLHIGDVASVGIAGKLTVNANAGDDQLYLGTFNDPNKVVRLLVVPILAGGAGSDLVRIFAQGNVQGPPGVVVFPTGPALAAAGWEGIA